MESHSGQGCIVVRYRKSTRRVGRVDERKRRVECLQKILAEQHLIFQSVLCRKLSILLKHLFPMEKSWTLFPDHLQPHFLRDCFYLSRVAILTRTRTATEELLGHHRPLRLVKGMHVRSTGFRSQAFWLYFQIQTCLLAAELL